MTHPFEAVGLGRPPYQVLGVETKHGPIIGDGTTVGTPGQPMGRCAYCGTRIAECWRLQSADGKTFEVGCICVYWLERRMPTPPHVRGPDETRNGD